MQIFFLHSQKIFRWHWKTQPWINQAVAPIEKWGDFPIQSSWFSGSVIQREKLGTYGRVPEIYQHIPPIYGLYNGFIGQYGVIFGEQLLGYPPKATQIFPLTNIFCFNSEFQSSNPHRLHHGFVPYCPRMRFFHRWGIRESGSRWSRGWIIISQKPSRP